jgi:hypothetical protein
VDLLACVRVVGPFDDDALAQLVSVLGAAGYRGFYELDVPPPADERDPVPRLTGAVVSLRRAYEQVLAAAGADHPQQRTKELQR